MSALSPTQQKLILHWGEMGTRWGINRTVAQIHALLYLSEEPLCAEDIAETLQVARSNVSTSLKELQTWGIVRVVPRIGDRRDFFASHADVWEMFRLILAERKKREIDPTLSVLRECSIELDAADAGTSFEAKRVDALLDFMETATGAFDQLNRLPTPALVKLAKMGEKMNRLAAELLS